MPQGNGAGNSVRVRVVVGQDQHTALASHCFEKLLWSWYNHLTATTRCHPGRSSPRERHTAGRNRDVVRRAGSHPCAPPHPQVHPHRHQYHHDKGKHSITSPVQAPMSDSLTPPSHQVRQTQGCIPIPPGTDRTDSPPAARGQPGQT
jgi:hypothetical protein